MSSASAAAWQSIDFRATLKKFLPHRHFRRFRHKRASAQAEIGDLIAPAATRPGWSPIPSAVYQSPNGC